MSKQLKAKVGHYTNKDGKQCGDYIKLGVVLSNNNGEYALIDPCVNLAGVLAKQNMLAVAEGKQSRSMVMFSIFDDSQQQAQQPVKQQDNSWRDDFDDTIPF